MLVTPEGVANGQAQIAVMPDSRVIMVLPRSASGMWGARDNQLHVYWIDPDAGEVLDARVIPKLDAESPDWLPSIEKAPAGIFLDDPRLIYTSGKLGRGNINDAKCSVRMVNLGIE